MAGERGLVRVTVTLPAELYARVRTRTDNVSAFVAETLARRLRNERLAEAVEDTAGLMAGTFTGLHTPEDIVAYLRRDRAGWNRGSE